MVNAKDNKLAIGLALLAVSGLVVGLLAYKQVPEGNAGVEKNLGAVTGNVLDSGPHVKAPFITTVQNVETRPRTYTMSNTQGEGQRSAADAVTVKTVNGSSVDVDITVRYRIDSDEADTFVEDWNNEQQMEERLIRPTIRTVLRDEASSLQTTGEDAIYTESGRQRMEVAALEALEEDFEDEPIVLEEVQIRNIDLPDSIDQQLDRKEEAKQQVQVEQEKVKQEEARAEQEIVRAEADAEATNIRGEALRNNPIVLRDRYIDALRDGEAVYVPTDSGGITLTRETSADAGNTTAVTPAD